ncbi:TPA: hypothetical protein DDW69_02600 [candidate division CPR2 bacterium]|uniref:DUF3324 domain-containing protein n=1 Tax=candidate division CPR2 bacterium GW2011_GWC1_41_48 TaxID=1618344 RepID=A0A0G0Z785_UNCC2|nr:MAG: hypothetical protein UT47_C0004G0015 [candidate division CPR2 bacterium GW2011_GWC2_39_35]KKS08893.1 MAG: hypothetical protein UU65_C0004G0104 [candidate division CPR2 bacterium GW2011_GWC1_41_48]OGB61726.1 MAG: hypothetical protein A2Y27_01280 [candidate division CPR2 bacterium GWD1_39_7]OGB72167.1 MAG: hypothetical protein A2Y26_00620 [candidate division CPR2 bacterium GWD2_39_7]HBG81710.1 hypothetical protein [candidate division CPR2 bacterium]
MKQYNFLKILKFSTMLFLFFLPIALMAEGGTGSSSSVTVIPPRFELYGSPGQSVSDQTIKIVNEQDREATYQIEVADFSAAGEDGGVELHDDQSDFTYSLAKWIRIDEKSVNIGPKKTAFIKFGIDLPKNAEPGGHYASIIVGMGGGAKVVNGASVNPRIASLVLLRVAGTVDEKAHIESFIAPKYSEKTPINLELRIKNRGQNHIKPKGTIVITNILGVKVDEIPLNGENVLPGSIRKMNTEWKHNKLLSGRYTATLVATYGEKNNQPLSASVSFIVFPKYLAGLYSVGIVSAAAVFIKRKKVKKILHNLTK